MNLRRCPECATHYELSIRTDADAGGAWIDADLERLTPGRVRELLGKDYPEHDRVIAFAEQAWVEGDAGARTWAADWLVDHHLRAGAADRVIQFLADAGTRATVLAAVLRYVQDKRSLPEAVRQALAPFAREAVHDFPQGTVFKLGTRLRTLGVKLPPG